MAEIKFTWSERRLKLESLLDSKINELSQASEVVGIVPPNKDDAIVIAGLIEAIRDCGYEVLKDDQRDQLRAVVNDMRVFSSNTTLALANQQAIQDYVNRLDQIDF